MNSNRQLQILLQTASFFSKQVAIFVLIISLGPIAAFSQDDFEVPDVLSQASVHSWSKNVLRVYEHIKYRPPASLTVIAEKRTGRMYVFKGGRLVAESKFLFGQIPNDEFPGGSMEASYSLKIPIQNKKVTPAGVFPMRMTEMDPDFGTSVTFAQYKSYRLAIHRLYRGNPKENRATRLKSPMVSDNLISSGCINVSDEFYDEVLARQIYRSDSRLYILPYREQDFDKYIQLQ